LQAYLSEKGADAKYQTEKNKDTLLKQVQNTWYETGDKAGETYGDAKSWLFNSWDDSSLKSFAEYHGIIPKPPSKREQLLAAVQENYDAAAAKASESAAYPGDWIYSQYTDSALKKWLDERGYPVPQPSTRDKLISSVRRNSYLASLKYNSIQSSLSASAEAAQQTLTDKLIDGWSDTQLKAFLDKNGIKVPQGSKKNELIAILRKHRAQLTGDTVASSASSAFGAATSMAGNEYAKATDNVAQMYNDAFNGAVDTWSESRLKAYLDSRGVPVGPDTTLDNLRAKVRLHRHKAATGYTAWTFDTWTTENLKKWISGQNKVASKKITGSRDELVASAQSLYSSASSAGGNTYASATSAMAVQTDSAKDSTFDTWSESDLKKYLDQYGIKTYQGSTVNELRALARRQYTFFKYGTSSPSETFYAKLQNGAYGAYDYFKSLVVGGLGGAQTGANSVSSAAAQASKSAKKEL